MLFLLLLLRLRLLPNASKNKCAREIDDTRKDEMQRRANKGKKREKTKIEKEGESLESFPELCGVLLSGAPPLRPIKDVSASSVP